MNKYFFIIILSIFLIIITVNPFTEELMYNNPIPYMLAHYSLFASGILLSYYMLKREILRGGVFIGIIIALIWHYPFFFDMGARILWIRIIEEITLFLGGFMLGSSLQKLKKNYKILLLVLWMIGDTFLSSVLMINPSSYTTIYNAQELEYLGIIMFLMMNLIAVYILLTYINKMLNEEKDIVNEDYQRNPYAKD